MFLKMYGHWLGFFCWFKCGLQIQYFFNIDAITFPKYGDQSFFLGEQLKLGMSISSYEQAQSSQKKLTRRTRIMPRAYKCGWLRTRTKCYFTKKLGLNEPFMDITCFSALGYKPNGKQQSWTLWKWCYDVRGCYVIDMI
jgi:hypothetical protein